MISPEECGIDVKPAARAAGRFGFLVTMMLALAVVGCGGGGDPERSAQRTNVDVAIAERDTLRVTVRSVGSLEADQRVALSAEIGGRISSITFEEGQEVAAGQILLRLDREKLHSQLKAAEATLARARSEAENFARQVERNDDLLEQGAISQQTYDDLSTRAQTAAAAADEAAANVALAGARLAEATIRAPFDGRTGVRRVDIGQYVSIGDTLVTLVDNDPLDIEFSIPERHLDRLEPGQAVSIHVASAPDTSFDGRVTFVSPEVDPSNRTVGVKATIPNPAGALRAGQFADVILVLEVRPDALVVPEESIVLRGGLSIVFEVEADTAYRRDVQLGEREPGRVQILAGLEAGDTLVVAGQQRLGDGTPVTPRLQPAAPAVKDRPASASPASSEED